MINCFQVLASSSTCAPLSWLELHDLFKVIKKAAKRMLNARIAGAFERWTDFTEEAVEMRVKLTRFMKKAGTEKNHARHVTLLNSNPHLLPSWGRIEYGRHVTLVMP